MKPLHGKRSLSFFIPVCLLAGMAHAMPVQAQSRAKSSQTQNGASSASAFQAAFTGDLAKLKRLFPNGAGINRQDKAGKTLLYYAVLGGRTDVVRWLVARKIAINAKDATGATALTMARRNTDDAELANRRAEIIAFLQEQGAQETIDASPPDSPPAQLATVQQPAQTQATLSMKGVTLTEIHMPASLSPRKGARPHLVPKGFSNDGKTVYARCMWIVDRDSAWEAIEDHDCVWSEKTGTRAVLDNSATWQTFLTARDKRMDGWGAWENAHEEEVKASLPDKTVQGFQVRGMALDGSVVCGIAVLLPADFKSPGMDQKKLLQELTNAPDKQARDKLLANATKSANEAEAAKAKVRIYFSFIWRQSMGFQDLNTYIKAKGKFWNGKLAAGPISDDGTTIACMTGTDGTDGNGLSQGSEILLVHSPSGLGKQAAQISTVQQTAQRSESQESQGSSIFIPAEIKAAYHKLASACQAKSPNMVISLWTDDYTSDLHWDMDEKIDRTKTMLRKQAEQDLHSAFPGNKDAPSEIYFLRSAKRNGDATSVDLLCYWMAPLNPKGLPPSQTNGIDTRPACVCQVMHFVDTWVLKGKVCKLKTRRYIRVPEAMPPDYRPSPEAEAQTEEFDKARQAGLVIQPR